MSQDTVLQMDYEDAPVHRGKFHSCWTALGFSLRFRKLAAQILTAIIIPQILLAFTNGDFTHFALDKDLSKQQFGESGTRGFSSMFIIMMLLGIVCFTGPITSPRIKSVLLFIGSLMLFIVGVLTAVFASYQDNPIDPTNATKQRPYRAVFYTFATFDFAISLCALLAFLTSTCECCKGGVDYDKDYEKKTRKNDLRLPHMTTVFREIVGETSKALGIATVFYIFTLADEVSNYYAITILGLMTFSIIAYCTKLEVEHNQKTNMITKGTLQRTLGLFLFGAVSHGFAGPLIVVVASKQTEKLNTYPGAPVRTVIFTMGSFSIAICLISFFFVFKWGRELAKYRDDHVEPQSTQTAASSSSGQQINYA